MADKQSQIHHFYVNKSNEMYNRDVINQLNKSKKSITRNNTQSWNTH